MASHRIHHPGPVEPGAAVQIRGDEAHHAIRVKRVEVGDAVELLDGRGSVAQSHVTQTLKLPKSEPDGPWAVDLLIDSVHAAPPLAPHIHIYAPVPKGDRLEQMVDQLSQVGATSWTPLESSRTIADPKQAKPDRLERVAIEAMKQCGRPWLLNLTNPASFADAIKPAPGVTLLIADPAGAAPPSTISDENIRVLIGPEGGFTPQEIQAAVSAGAQPTNFGAHVMRIETAAVIAAAILRQGTALCAK